MLNVCQPESHARGALAFAGVDDNVESGLLSFALISTSDQREEAESIVARESFSTQADGAHGDGTPFGEHGEITNLEWYEAIRRRTGFSDAR